MPAGWTCCGAPISGSIAHPGAATKRASGGAAMTSMKNWARQADHAGGTIAKKSGRNPMAQPCRSADFRCHGAAHGCVRQLAADALFGSDERLTLQRNGSHVSADEPVPLRTLAEADRLYIGVT